MIFLILFSVIITVLLFMWIRETNRKMKLITNVPKLPGSWPIIGNAHILFGDTENVWNVMREVSRHTNIETGVLTAWLGPKLLFVITDPEVALSLSNLDKSYLYNFAENWIGNGLICSSAEIWKRHRKLLGPTFHQHVLDGFMGVFNRQAEVLVEDLRPMVNEGPFDHWHVLADNALETICQTAMGLKRGETKVVDEEYKRAFGRVLRLIADRAISVWLHLDLVYNFTKKKKEQDSLTEVLQDKSLTMMNSRKAEMEFDKKNSMKGTQRDRTKPFLDLMLELGAEGFLTDTEIREELDTILVAGHDTTSSSLMFSLLMLGSHPGVQEKVYEELLQVLGEEPRDVTKNDLINLVFLEAVIKETLRLYPVAPLIMREAYKDVKLENFTVPSGSMIVLSIWGIHTNKKMWGEDAEEFRPERWLDLSTVPTTPAAFSAFGVGRRYCLGKNYALMSMKVTLAHILRRYKVSADHSNLKIKLDVVLKAVNGHQISLTPR